MADETEPTPLYAHTLESLCAELVSGRAILMPDRKDPFHLTSAETRSLFEWYRKNRSKWFGKNQKTDVEDLTNCMGQTPPVLPPSVPSGKKTGRVLHLKSVRIHRFAGVHRYGTPRTPPSDVKFELTKPLTLIEGANGSGKTSLLNAITWCLTGRVRRSQRGPEAAREPVEIALADELDDTSQEEVKYDISAVTPKPSASVIRDLSGGQVPLDTWVELELVDDAGGPIATVRRDVSRSPRGSVEIGEPDFTSLGLDPISREIGTCMPAFIPYMQIDGTSDLGKAIAALTGFKPLEDLVVHVSKSIEKLTGELVRDRRKDIDILKGQYHTSQSGLAKLLEDYPGIKPDADLAGLTSKAVESHFERLQSQALSQAKSILGDTFDPAERTIRDDLFNSVGPALGLLDQHALSNLPSAKLLADLRRLTPDELVNGEMLVTRVEHEAKELADLAANPAVAARLQLYARIAGWIKQQGGTTHDTSCCPVCQSVLEGKTDPVTNELVSEHLRRFVARDCEHLQKTLQAWCSAAEKALLADLPQTLREAVQNDLPGSPAMLLVHAFSEELFRPQYFAGSLAPLKPTMRQNCNDALKSLPPFVEPPDPNLPTTLLGTDQIVRVLRRLKRAIAFARWRQDNDAACLEMFLAVVGKTQPDGDARRTGVSGAECVSLSSKLIALDEMVKNAFPIRQALEKLGTMQEKVLAIAAKEARIQDYGRAAEALKPLLMMRDLVESQVGLLMNRLSSAVNDLKGRFYLPAFKGAPVTGRTEVTTDGSVAVRAESDGTSASAQYISNASDLRATLLALLIAFWQYLLEERGGLALLLLDDLQELFDPNNRERLARCIADVTYKGGRVVVTTCDPVFGRRVAAAAGKSRVDHRQIHPLRDLRPHIELGEFNEEIEEKRKAFESPQNQNEHQPARDYINHLRIYIENHLIDTLDPAPIPLATDPTLADLIKAIRTRQNAGEQAFCSEPFRRLLSSTELAPDGAFLRLMNKSHHGSQNDITFNDVWQIRKSCVRVRELVEAAYEEYERWMRREPVLEVQEIAEPPEPVVVLPRRVPLFADLAAFCSDAAPGETSALEEPFLLSFEAGYAVYLINTHNFGFSASVYSRAIVSLSDSPVPDDSLVIALRADRAYARRLLRSDQSPGIITLASEAENPRERPPTIVCPQSEVRLLRVVGVMFSDSPVYPRPNTEAAPFNDPSLFSRVEVAFKVRGESALPLALPDQYILGGRILTARDITAMEGSLAALATNDGSALKRIGRALPRAPHVRLFNSVGGLGESLLARVEEVEDALSGIPLVASAREVLGVVYESL